jgi:hypothetical protein
MDDDVANDGDATMDRRALIKKVGVAGAVAWTAPVVMDSVLSPAAAQSAPPPPGPTPFDYTEDFEGVVGGGSPITSGPSYFTYGAGPLTGAPGWNVTAGSVDAIDVGNTFPYDTGGFVADSTVIELGGSGTGAGTLVWSVNIPGAQNVILEFDWKNPSANGATVTVAQGGTIFGPSALAAGQNSVVSFSSGSFAAGNGPLTITFAGSGANNAGAIIDNVRIYSA